VNVLDELGCQVVDLANFGSRWDMYARVRLLGVKVLYFNPADPLVRADRVGVVRDTLGSGYLFGLYFLVPQSTVESDGIVFANLCSQTIEDFGGLAKVSAAMFDNEKVPLASQRALIQRWDQIRYGRPTVWNVEPYQDASQNDYTMMLARNQAVPVPVRKIAAQTYFGGMQPQPIRAVIAYLTSRGVARDDVMPCTDPAQPTPYAWQVASAGCRGATLFQAGRIPV